MRTILNDWSTRTLLMAVLGIVLTGSFPSVVLAVPGSDPGSQYVECNDDGCEIKASTDAPTSADVDVIDDPYIVQWAIDNCPVGGTIEVGSFALNFGDDGANGPREYVTIRESVTIRGQTELELDERNRPTGAAISGVVPTEIVGGGFIKHGEVERRGGVFYAPQGVSLSVTIENIWFHEWAGDALVFDHDGPETVAGCKFTQPVFDQRYGFLPFPPPSPYHFHAINSYGRFSTSPHVSMIHRNYIDMLPLNGQFNRNSEGVITDDTFGVALVGEFTNVVGDVANNTAKNATQFQLFTFLNPGGTQIRENLVETGNNPYLPGFSSGIGVGVVANNVEIFQNEIHTAPGFFGVHFWGGSDSRASDNHVILDGGGGLAITEGGNGIQLENNTLSGHGSTGMQVMSANNEATANNLTAFHAEGAQVFVGPEGFDNSFTENQFGGIVGNAEAGLICHGGNNDFLNNLWKVNYPSWKSGRGLWLMAEGAQTNTVEIGSSNVSGTVKPNKHWRDDNFSNYLIVDGVQIRP